MICKICLQQTDQGEYHASCLKKLFGTTQLPQIDINKNEILQLAKEMLEHHLAVTGVQKKMSLGIVTNRGAPSRLTLMNVKANFILKPDSDEFSELPANEHLTMQLANLFKIKTASNGLIKIADELAYITRRFDREKNYKIHIEDMAQLTESMTEHKYRGSIEKIGKVVKKYSSFPGNDLFRLLELTLFCFITGNSDMHLKNFSLGHFKKGIELTPAYDLLNTKLVMPDDIEESALSINGKKNKITLNDFEALADKLAISEKVFAKLLKRFITTVPKAQKLIQNSFLSPKLQHKYYQIMQERIERLKN